MELDLKGIGARIRYFRNKKKLSQEALAEMVSVNNDHISRIESGRVRPSLQLLVAIANALEVSIDDILVDNLTHPNSITGDEIHTLLLDCSDNEKKMLTKTVSFMKALLSEFGI